MWDLCLITCPYCLGTGSCTKTMFQSMCLFKIASLHSTPASITKIPVRSPGGRSRRDWRPNVPLWFLI